MDWREDGILLSVRGHGETSAILEVFTREHGRHAGVVRGGTSRKLAPVLQPGAQLDLTWRARLEDHIGSFTVEPVKGRAAAVLGDRLALAAMASALALAGFALPERASYPGFYDRTAALLDAMVDGTGWLPAYLDWEVALLEEMGFGLDLSVCAVTGGTEDLAYVSPRTGRAVSVAGAGSWADRLLPLPPCLLGEPATLDDIRAGMSTTGHFLANRLALALGDKPLPAARRRFSDLLDRQG